jgi:ABC-type branched-subunit amino acid transport system permease subunit
VKRALLAAAVILGAMVGALAGALWAAEQVDRDELAVGA